jgi:hypothetical protein
MKKQQKKVKTLTIYQLIKKLLLYFYASRAI